MPTDDTITWFSLLSDLIVPVAAILLSSLLGALAIIISVVLAVQVSRSEREASDIARREDAYRAAAESVINALAHFVSIDPNTEDFRTLIRDLRAKVTIFQTVTRGEVQRDFGTWLAKECEFGTGEFLDAMLVTQQTGRPDPDNYSGPHDWAARTLNTFAHWLVEPIDHDQVKQKIEDLQEAATNRILGR